MGLFSDADLIWRLSLGAGALSFLVMAGAATYFLYRRRDFEYRVLGWLFIAGLFGNTLTRANLIWFGLQSLPARQEATTIVNALFAVAMAAAALKILPSALRMASRKELARINLSLREEAQSRNQAEERLRHLAESDRLASEAKLRSYFESASQAILAVNSEGKLLLVNRRTEEMFGYGRIEMLGQELELLIPERFRAAHVGHRLGFFSEPRVRSMGSAGMELVGRRKDGSEFPVEIGLSYAEGDEGVVALGLVSDITERKRGAEELERINTELRRSNAELEQFAYVASHDLQEPLRMISSYLNLLERRYQDRLDGDAREFIHFAVEGSRRMKTLIQDLLSFSRVGRQAVEIREVEAAQIVSAALANLAAAIADRDAEIAVEPLPPVFADQGLMTQVFQNLIANAIKFHKEGRPRVSISAERRGAEWIFSIRDNGIGIDPKHAARIFRIFERLHGAEAYPGTGVGLAVAQKIVERHRGRIWVNSEPGNGSTFSFALPAEPVTSSSHPRTLASGK